VASVTDGRRPKGAGRSPWPKDATIGPAYQTARKLDAAWGLSQGGAKGLGPETTGFTGLGHRGERRLGSHANLVCEQLGGDRSSRKAQAWPANSPAIARRRKWHRESVIGARGVTGRRRFLAPPETVGAPPAIRWCPVQQVRTRHEQQPGQGGGFSQRRWHRGDDPRRARVLGRSAPDHRQPPNRRSNEQIGQRTGNTDRSVPWPSTLDRATRKAGCSAGAAGVKERRAMPAIGLAQGNRGKGRSGRAASMRLAEEEGKAPCGLGQIDTAAGSASG